MQQKLEVQEIKLSPKLEPYLAYYDCNFCNKQVPTTKATHLAKLSGDSFYCSHCIRHGYNSKNRRNVLITSFKSLFGYYYQAFCVSTRKLWVSELKELHDLHVQVGLQMPVLSYDPETMYWFIDYNKIGRGRKKINHKHVCHTIIDIISCFNLPEYLDKVKINKFASKYLIAMREFYAHRHRPDNKKLLLPTLYNCGDLPVATNMEATKNFTFQKIY
jgi:hypothetical protein